MLRVAITGGIACGKSLLLDGLSRLGAEVLDADDVAHELEAPRGSATLLVAEAFGKDVLNADGGIDRRRLGEKVFSTPSALAELNAIIHPLIRKEIHGWVVRPGKKLKVVAIPLLFECGWRDDWDFTVCLASDEETQVRRMVECRGLSVDDARRRIAAQMPVSEKAALSDWTVENNGTLATLRMQESRLYAELLRRLAGVEQV